MGGGEFWKSLLANSTQDKSPWEHIINIDQALSIFFLSASSLDCPRIKCASKLKAINNNTNHYFKDFIYLFSYLFIYLFIYVLERAHESEIGFGRREEGQAGLALSA